MRRLLLSLGALALSACASHKNSLQGPAVDLHQLATPAPPVVVAPVLPPVPAGQWRVWVPPHMTDNQERIEGHFTYIPLAPPVVPVAAPPMPRTAKTSPVAASPSTPPVAPSAQTAPVQVVPSALPNIPNGVLPNGMRAKGSNRLPVAPEGAVAPMALPGIPQQLPGVPQ